ncbi:CHC2 zinc finger domain-containing protein [Bacillus subtilis]|uniref:CHC2 zinc finger domain-containing protein n=1 Tax=Bacillus subtilis TaxID=1423 RepID=UPI002B4B8F2D|nr:CHC2 zinc finger domain-containing protein [Bacillus subtilis]
MVCKINPSLNYIITEIKSKIDILTVVEESNLHLSKRGRNYMGLCPFHNEKTASFSVNPQKNIFKCFGCGISGDQINLYARLHDIDNGQAIYQLSQRIGLTGKRLTKQQKVVISEQQEDRKLEKKFEKEYTQLFNYLCNLQNSMKAKAKKYKEMNHLEKDSLLIHYYHEKAYHEYLLDGLLAGLLEEIDFDQQIDFFELANGVVDNWKNLLKNQKLKGFENVELISY